jgi:hypothetical protein
VRAFPADASQYVGRLLGAIFPLHAGAVVPEQVPARDVTLAPGEARAFDLALDCPATGIVQGTVTVNGRPAAGRAVLRPLPGEAPGAGGQSLRGDCDAYGAFTIRDVPAGKYTLAISGATRQELHSEPVAVEPGGTAVVARDLQAGGLRGTVTAPDAAPADLRGYVWVLPGAAAAPEDLYEYRRTHRTHRIQVRNGAFEDAQLTPGPAVVVADLRGRRIVATNATIAAGGMADVAFEARAQRQQ